MITFVRTTVGSNLNLGSVVEAIRTDDGLFTLILSDGEIRHVNECDWERALATNDSRLLAAAPGTFVLRQTGGDIPEVFREPVIAWLVNGQLYPKAITVDGIPGEEIGSPTIMTPDGSVQNAYYQFPDYDSWLRVTLRAPHDPDRTLGCGGERAYYQNNGRVRLGAELDPFI